MSHSLGSVAQEPCQRNNGNGIHGKDHCGRHVRNKLDGDADGDKDQQQVDPAVEQDLLEGQVES